MGLAVVASRVGGFIDLVKPGENGFLVENNEEAGYAKAVRDLLCNPELLLRSRKASRRIAAEFDIQKIADRYDELFQQIHPTLDRISVR